jgi:hypothetical protein
VTGRHRQTGGNGSAYAGCIARFEVRCAVMHDPTLLRNAGGCNWPLTRGAVHIKALLAAYRVQAAPQPGPSETPPALQVAYTAAELNALSSLARQVACYEDQIERLKACNRLTNEQREQWRLKAQQAEAKLADSSQSVASADAKRHYNALKHRLAKMLHPDSVSGPTENRSAQEALFVEIWAAIDQIERPGRSSSVTRS